MQVVTRNKQNFYSRISVIFVVSKNFKRLVFIPINAKQTAIWICFYLIEIYLRYTFYRKKLIIVFSSTFVVRQNSLEFFTITFSVHSYHPFHIPRVILLFFSTIDIFNCKSQFDMFLSRIDPFSSRIKVFLIKLAHYWVIFRYQVLKLNTCVH